MNQFKKIMLCISEDWFAVSHFLPLLDVLKTISDDVVLVTNCSAHRLRLERENVRVIPFDFRRSDSGVGRNLEMTWRLRSVIAHEQPDVVHLVAMKPIAIGGVAAMTIPHTAVVAHVTGLGFLPASRGIRDLFATQVVGRVIQRLTRRPNGWLVAENPEDVSFFRDRYGEFENSPVITNGSGVDGEALAQNIQYETDTPRIVMACRLLHAKGVEDLLDAAAILQTQNMSFHIDLYGGLDANNRDSFSEHDIDRWRTRPYVTLHGHVEDRGEIWKDKSIAVLASREREGLPRSLLEAGAAGLALIATDIPGNRYVVRDGRDGLLVPPKTPEALASALTRLLQDRRLRKTLGEEAQQRVRQEFSVANVQARLHDLYERIRDAKQ